jgi:5,10-methenyltetrahydromethanopterin hydrogenase
VRISSLAKIMIGVEDVVVKDVSFDEDAQAIVIDAKALQAPLLQMR